MKDFKMVYSVFSISNVRNHHEPTFFLKSLLFSFPSLKKQNYACFFVLPPYHLLLIFFFLNFFVVRNFFSYNTTCKTKWGLYYYIIIYNPFNYWRKKIIPFSLEKKLHKLISSVKTNKKTKSKTNGRKSSRKPKVLSKKY